ncbi:hypothetical protein [Staphylococcus aureus]|uniref:hypothetical protein n=1 Tax=Staphylococcus aureus TaxID=1280 RepID=UPI000CFF9A1B|nr:hypothetical protein [Staphylococcus aureus]
MYKVKYSSFNYYPDILLISNIAVGVIFQIEGNNGYYANEFNLMQRKNKLFSFDEELDKDFTKMFLKSIRENFLNFKGEIKEFTRFYVNNFKFTNIQIRNFDSLDEAKAFIEDTTKYILHPTQEAGNKIKVINNSPQALFNIRSYVAHAWFNKENLTFIMDDDMESEQRYVNSLTREFNNEAEINAIFCIVIPNFQLIKLYTRNLQ